MCPIERDDAPVAGPVLSGQRLPMEMPADCVRGFCANVDVLIAAGACRDAQPFPLTKPKWPRGAMLAHQPEANPTQLQGISTGQLDRGCDRASVDQCAIATAEVLDCPHAIDCA